MKIKLQNPPIPTTSDTIGGIVLTLDKHTNTVDLCLGTSSGGPWLKLPGRVGSVIIKYINLYRQV